MKKIKEPTKKNYKRAKQICDIYNAHVKYTDFETFLMFCDEPEKIQYILDYKYNIESSVYHSDFLQIKIDR